MTKAIAMVGRRFGRLTVLERVEDPGKERRWLCACDCGTQTVAFGTNIRRGLTSSCGCFRAEMLSARFTENLSGRRFGDLTAVSRTLDYVAPNRARHVQWECECECGRRFVAKASELRSGHTTTCGCRRYARLFDQDHTLYRLFDDAGVLLYIGVTNEWSRRDGEHARTKPWWGEVTRVERKSFPTRDSVLAAEKHAIRSENPRYNIERYLGGDAK